MGTQCKADTKVHVDAVSIVEFLFDIGGTTDLPHDEIAYKIGMHARQGGQVVVNTRRYQRARQHLMEGVDGEGRPCCGYKINYRRSAGKGSTLSLVDPSGDLGNHAQAAMGSVLGWAQRERQHQTENRRQIAEFEALRDHALANEDYEGYRVCQTAIIDLDRDGTVLPDTMAQLMVWAQRISS